MSTMKAARWHGIKDIRVEQVSIPKAGENQVKIAVKFAGICGSDLHEYNHGPQLIPWDTPYPLNNHKGVTTLGHEFSGVVEEVGSNVKHLKKGDRVVVEPIFRNPDSPFVERGEYNLGEYLGFVGLTSDGGFANFAIVEDYMVHKMPENMSFEQGALVEPAAVAVYAVSQSNLQLGQSVLVSGAGPIGLLAAQAAIARGASQVIVTDVAQKRLDKATQIGATTVLNALDPELDKKIKSLTDGLGVDVFLDCAGVQASFDQGIKALRNGGCAVLVALFGKPVQMDALDLVLREITIKGVIAYRNNFPETMALISSGRMAVEKLVTSKINLDHIVDKGFEVLVSNPTQVKILVEIGK
ncbi:2,3-butanediol dehydrogenase [Myroides sp. LJL115]